MADPPRAQPHTPAYLYWKLCPGSNTIPDPESPITTFQAHHTGYTRQMVECPACRRQKRLKANGTLTRHQFPRNRP